MSIRYLQAGLIWYFRCMFPTVGGSMRQMPDDVEIGGYHIPKGVIVKFTYGNGVC